MTLSGVLTADARYICGSRAFFGNGLNFKCEILHIYVDNIYVHTGST